MANANGLENLRQTIRTGASTRIVFAFLLEHKACEGYVVGGSVRDAILGREAADQDFVLCGVTKKEIEAWFGARGKLDFAGRNFGVYKFTETGGAVEIDIAMPRTEKPTAKSEGGFRDFETRSYANLPIADDLARRNFTVNAMAFNVRTNELTDPFGGRGDLLGKVIRAVGKPETRFTEDLTRVLRAIRFACQLGFEIEEKTWDALCAKAPGINRQRKNEVGVFV